MFILTIDRLIIELTLLLGKNVEYLGIDVSLTAVIILENKMSHVLGEDA